MYVYIIVFIIVLSDHHIYVFIFLARHCLRLYIRASVEQQGSSVDKGNRGTSSLAPVPAEPRLPLAAPSALTSAQASSSKASVSNKRARDFFEAEFLPHSSVWIDSNSSWMEIGCPRPTGIKRQLRH